MKSTILILVFTMLCKGAVVSVCTTGCTTTSLQTAFDSLAACGDTIQIKSTETQIGNFTITFRGCDSNPITVTSDRGAWLPSATTRITPSHLANMAHITTNNTNPAVAGVLDVMNRPPSGWNFVGVAFTSASLAGTFDLVGFNVHGEAVNAAQVADNITFDRCYFYAPSIYTTVSIQDVIRADATNLTLKNSFFGDAFWNGYVESHGLRMLTSAGPITATNNFVITSGAPIFSGGAVPSYPTYLGNGVTAQYNYFWRPWKWNGDPAQPFAADYVAAAQGTFRTGPYAITNVSNTGIVTTSGDFGALINASLLTITGAGGCTVANNTNWRSMLLSSTTVQLLNFPGCNSAYTSGGSINEFAVTVCTKNLGEFKWGTGITWQYNVGENSWFFNQCMSQYNGFTDTLRVERDTPGKIFSFTDSTHITWAGSYRIAVSGDSSMLTGDLGLCLSITTTGTECHAIASFSGASLVTATAFSSAPIGTFTGWISYTASAKLENLAISHNTFKNVDQAYTVLGIGFGNGVGDSAYGKNHSITENLWLANTSYIQGNNGFHLGSGEQADFSTNPAGYIFDHNTLHYPNGIAHGAFVYLDGTGCPAPSQCATSRQPKFDTSAITNNLFGVASAGGNGPFSGDSVGNTIDTANFYFLNTNIKNNAIPGGTNGTNTVTGGNAVSGNQYQSWVDPFGGMARKGIFKLAPGGAYSGSGSDRRDVGIDFDRLPQISSVKVTAGVTAALLEFDLTMPILDAAATQPCILEVSSSRNLQSDLGSYAVVNDLNPAFFKQPDTSARSNMALPAVVVSGRHVYWPIGQNATVTGDDGAAHDLTLAAGTTFYGRLMCYGDSQQFTFQTGSGLASSVRYPLSATLQAGTTAGTSSVRLQYGGTAALGSTANFTPNGNGTVSVALPLLNGSPTYYKLQFLNGATVTYTSPIAVYLGGA
jgi:hypothetical protein